MLAHLARDVGEDFVSVRKFDAEHCVGQCFDDRAFNLDYAIFVSHFSVRELLGTTRRAVDVAHHEGAGMPQASARVRSLLPGAAHDLEEGSGCFR